MIEKETDIWPWLMLRNALIERAVYDYEMLISEAPIPIGRDHVAQEMTIPAIKAFVKGTDTEEWLKKISRIYHEKFKPYAKRNYKRIIKDWKEIEKIENKTEREAAMKNSRNKCPLCGGTLKPVKICGLDAIGCSFCYLNILKPKERKK